MELPLTIHEDSPVGFGIARRARSRKAKGGLRALLGRAPDAREIGDRLMRIARRMLGEAVVDATAKRVTLQLHPAAGPVRIVVLPDGSVYPCYLLFSRPEFRLGNLLADAFAAIWDSPRLEFFRSFRGNACPREACEHHAACRGGCPAVSLLVAGDLTLPDPRCVPPTAP